MNNLIFDKEHQLDKLRIFLKEIEDSLHKFAGRKCIEFLFETFNLPVDPLLIGGDYETTLLDKHYQISNKDEIVKILKPFCDNRLNIVKEFLESPDYTQIQTKWEGYIKPDGTDILFNDAWGRVNRHDLINDFNQYIYKTGDYFNIKWTRFKLHKEE